MKKNPAEKPESRMQGDRKSEQSVASTSSESEKKAKEPKENPHELTAEVTEKKPFKKSSYTAIEINNEEPALRQPTAKEPVLRQPTVQEPVLRQSSSSPKKFLSKSPEIKEERPTLRQSSSTPKYLPSRSVDFKEKITTSPRNDPKKSVKNDQVEPALSEFKWSTNKKHLRRLVLNGRSELAELLDKLEDKHRFQYTVKIPKAPSVEKPEATIKETEEVPRIKIKKKIMKTTPKDQKYDLLGVKTEGDKMKDVETTPDDKKDNLMEGDVGAKITVKEILANKGKFENEMGMYYEMPATSSEIFKLMECGDLEFSSSSESLCSSEDDVKKDGPLRIITEKQIMAAKELCPTESMTQRLRESKEHLFRTISEHIGKILPGKKSIPITVATPPTQDVGKNNS